MTAPWYSTLPDDEEIEASAPWLSRPSRCAGPGCHHLLHPANEHRSFWFCSDPCLMRAVVDRWSAQINAAFESLRPVFARLAETMSATAEQVRTVFEFVLVPPKRTGPPPLAIDGHAYRNRTRRRTRRTTRRSR